MKMMPAIPLVSGYRKQGRGLRVLGSNRETASFRDILEKNNELRKGEVPGFTKPIHTPPPAVHGRGSGPLDLLKRIFSFFHPAGSESRKLRLLETVSLGEKRFVALIQAEGKSFLIGGCSSGVSLLSRLDNLSNNSLVPERDESLPEIPQ